MCAICVSVFVLWKAAAIVLQNQCLTVSRTQDAGQSHRSGSCLLLNTRGESLEEKRKERRQQHTYFKADNAHSVPSALRPTSGQLSQRAPPPAPQPISQGEDLISVTPQVKDISFIIHGYCRKVRYPLRAKGQGS